MINSYGQLEEKDKYQNYKEFSSLVAKELKRYPFIFVKKGDAKKVRSMYNKGYTLSDVMSYFIMKN